METAGHTLEEIAIAFGDKAFIDSDEDVVRSTDFGTHANQEKAKV